MAPALDLSTCSGHFDDNIIWMLNLWNIDVFNLDLEGSLIIDSLHLGLGRHLDRSGMFGILWVTQLEWDAFAMGEKGLRSMMREGRAQQVSAYVWMTCLRP